MKDSPGRGADDAGAGPVVHVIAPSHAGGAETVVMALAGAATDRTRVVILNQVAAPDAPPFPLAALMRQRGIAVEEIRCGRRRYAAEARALEHHLREVGARLVHTHGYHATWVGSRAAQGIGIPSVATVHGYLKRTLRERLYNALDRRVLRRFAAVIAVSEGIRSELIRSGIPPSRIHVVQNGLASAPRTGGRDAARRLLQLGVEDHVVGWVGRLSVEKGPDLFLRALEGIGIPLTAVVVGDGPERERLEAMTRQLDLGEVRLQFAGHRTDVDELLPAFDVIALTSRMEGTPMIILEAVASGVAIVSFAVGGVPQLLGSDSAWLVPQGDVAALRDALRTALTSADEATARAALARARLSDRLSLDKWLANVWNVYIIALNQS